MQLFFIFFYATLNIQSTYMLITCEWANIIIIIIQKTFVRRTLSASELESEAPEQRDVGLLMKINQFVHL